MISMQEISVSRMVKYSACIVFASLCVSSTIDTGMFVYPSLSRYLLLEIGIVVLSGISILSCMADNKNVFKSWYCVFILAWIVYISLHTIFTSPHEIYKTMYLVVTLSLILVLGICLRASLLSNKVIENGLLLIAAIHIIYIAAQKLGVAISANKYFAIVGSNDNPTVTALYFVGILPILISRAKRTNWHWTYAIFTFFVIAGLLVLRCRTAYVGLFIEAAVYIGMCYKGKVHVIKTHPFRNSIILAVVMVMLSVTGTWLYNMKKDSADGRILIWKLSAGMLADRPQGYGYGLFEKYYNLRQAEYFSKNDASSMEKRNADFVYMPYNDYLEQGIEGGIVGMLFLMAFYTMNIRKAWKGNKVREAAVLTAFCVMSLTNFVCTSIQPWLLVICCSALTMTDRDKEKSQQQSHLRAAKVLNAFALTLFATCACSVVLITRAQLALKSLDIEMKTVGKVHDGKFGAIEKSVSTSEAYWRIRAKNSMSQDFSDNAIAYIRKARLYSSAPELLGLESEYLRRNGDTVTSMQLIDTLSDILPHVLRLKLILMRYNASCEEREDALRYAADILSTGAKYDTYEARAIIQEAKKYYEIYEK
ncbi:MAG: O-antigen ligase family protein [Prevotella sp.]|nr:O-antigen ligase family protein [Prevotella sp.]MDY5849918.1 O-antigen ligase family protein [Prevotella sp.]